MSQAVAFGSLTIVDLDDLGEFSVQPMSNLPLAVMYDPDSNSFTPNWGSTTTQLTITPSIYYGGTNIPLSSSDLRVTWQKQLGAGSYIDIDGTGDETIIDGGKLRVATNVWTASSTMITYIVTAKYTEPTTQHILTAQGQITYSLVKNASKVKNCTITGDSIFKYDTNRTLVGSQTITLNAEVPNVTITGWKYQNASGSWVKYPGSGTGKTLTVNSNDDVFTDERVVIKCETNDSTVFDIHTITKLYDGAPGSGTVSAVLTNDDQMVPFSGDTGDFSAAISRIIIYEGGVNVTKDWTITQTLQNVSATASKSGTDGADNDTTTVTGFLDGKSTGNVIFTCKQTGYADITKTFSVVKVSSGADGKSPTIYTLEADALALNRSTSGLTPDKVSVSAYQQTGTNKDVYRGRINFYENLTYEDWSTADPKPSPSIGTGSDVKSASYSPSANATSVLCLLFEAGGTTTLLDHQTVVITSDGKKGEDGGPGPEGKSAVSVILGNYADVLSCTNDNKLIAAQTIKIPFGAYEGTTRIPCTVTKVNLLGKAATSANATASADGYIQWALTAGTAVSAASGTLAITFKATASSGTVTVIENYSWSRNTASKDGQNAVILQIFTPDGTNVFAPGVESIVLQATLMDGATSKTSVIDKDDWAWAKWSNGAYVTIPNESTAYQHTVLPGDVDSYASFRCQATYNSITYTAYFSVFDKTDPIQVSVLSTIGTQIVNNDGYGALYVKVTRNGRDEDDILTENFRTSDPTGASAGDYYYKIDTANKSVTLMEYVDGSGWIPYSSRHTTEQDPPNPYKGTYTWTWRDKDGNSITTVNNQALPTSGKVIYIDGTFIDRKITADVEVSIG